MVSNVGGVPCVSNRCVPERKVLNVLSLTQCVPWTTRPLDGASLGRSGRDKEQALTWQKIEEMVSRRRVGVEGLREEKADLVRRTLGVKSRLGR
jgi:hypothetical protein